MRFRFCLIASLLCLAIQGIVRADGLFRDGFSGRVAGRGGTNIGFADSGSAIYDNPAALVNIQANHMTQIGLDMLISDLDYADPTRDVSSTHNPVPLGSLAFVRNNGDFAYGIGVFSPAGFSAQYDMAGPAAFPGLQRYKSFGALGKILPAVSMRVNDQLSVGATLGVAVSHVELEGPYFLQTPGGLFGTPMLLDLQATGAAVTWSFGLQYELNECTTLGLTYHGETRFHLEGPTRSQVFGVGTTTLDTQFDIAWPRSLGVGLKHDLDCCQTIALDAVWFDWSHAFDEFNMNFTNASHPVVAALIGGGLIENVPLRWRDSISIRVGYERQLSNDRAIRCGYVYHRNPVPSSTLTPYIQTILEHNFSIGYGWNLFGWEADLAYQFTFGPTQAVGTSAFFGGDFNNSRHHAIAHALYLSLIKRY